ncbi:MAG: mandelate racemase [Planctomycetaceae bacterium]|nr:mandelate racemase [Planctomycetaceae bacterium]
MQLSVKETRVGLLNSTTRIPFRYGKACLTRCPQAIVQVVIEADDKVQAGYSGDCLPPSWFDKSPDKDYARQIDDMLAVIQVAEAIYREEFASAQVFFAGWRRAYQGVQEQAAIRGMTPLLASFGASLLERATIDALCRMAGVSFATAVRSDLLGIQAGEIFAELSGLAPRDWLPDQPVKSIYVRHTVGLSDPLTAGDIPESERLSDGFPQALEEYIEQCGLRYLKVKVSNQLTNDIDRLRHITEIVERHQGDDYRLTLDGNEQYSSASDFDALIAAITSDDKLHTLWRNTLLIEQPLERSVAVDEAITGGIRELAATKPVIIDESDGALDSYQRAIELGYRGVSSKNCKGAMKSLLNAGLTWLKNYRGTRADYVMTGEDLCSVGIVPVQADMCLVATLGLSHIERNGHHYHPGLSYLPEQQRAAALAKHSDLYANRNDIIAPRLVDGQFEIESLQCEGFGFAVEPDMDAMQSPEEWDFASLGL